MLLVVFLFAFLGISRANTTIIPVAAPDVIPYTSQTRCIQSFPIDSEKLYYLTLAAINANHFIPIEAQTRAGYVLFGVGRKDFLATIARADEKMSVLKIAPADNSYYFSENIINNIFYYIANHIDTETISIKQVGND